MKHPDCVNKGRGRLHFLPKNVSLKESYYICVSVNFVHTLWDICEFDIVMDDDAPTHMSKTIADFLSDHNINIL